MRVLDQLADRANHLTDILDFQERVKAAIVLIEEADKIKSHESPHIMAEIVMEELLKIEGYDAVIQAIQDMNSEFHYA